MSECFECGRLALHDHHVVPKSLGGTKTVPLCEECHSKVHNTDLSLSKLQREAVKRTVARYKAEGRKWGGGGWNKVSPNLYPRIIELRKAGAALSEIAAEVNLSHTTVSRIATTLVGYKNRQPEKRLG